MATDGLKMAWKVAKLAHKVYRACQQARDNQENLADLGNYVFSVHHCLNSLREDILNDQAVLDQLQAVEKTLEKTEVFIESEQRGFENNGRLKRRLRALFKAKSQAERISTLHEELQSRLQQLTALTTTNCQALLNQLGDKFSEMQNSLYGHQHEFRDVMLELFEQQAKKMEEKMEEAFQNMCQAERDRQVVDVLRQSVDAVEGVLRQKRHLSTSTTTAPSAEAVEDIPLSDVHSKRAWQQRGIHLINATQLQVGELVGCGGYGKVYRGMWINIPVAVKKVLTGTMTDQMLTRVIEEARLHNILRDENLVEMKGISLPNGARSDPWIVMELMDMGLDEFINEQHDDMSPAALLDIGLQIATALEKLHSLYNVLHCDLKAANVLMKRDARCKYGWRAKLSDFGMSEARETVSMSVQANGTPPDTSSDSVGVVGTPATMDPEVMLGKRYGRSSDMYSFGVVLYELVTGEQAWEGVARVEAVKEAVLRGERPQIPDENPWDGLVEDDVWDGVCRLISRCWVAEAGDRPSFPEVCKEMTEILGRVDVVENEREAPDEENGNPDPEGESDDATPAHIRNDVALLRGGTAHEKERAVERIRVLVRDDQSSRRVVATAGGIPPLVELLRSGTAVAKENAAVALQNLAVNAENQVSIASAGGIPPLVELLRSGTAVAKENAAAALQNLSINDENEVSIASAGGIPPLVELLRSGTAVAKENAAAALQNLAVNAENEVSIASAGGIPPLVELLRSGTAVVKENAADALKNLSVNAENQVSIASAGGIPPLVELLRSGTAVAKENAASALWNLAANDENQVSIVSAGGIPPLVELLRSGTAVAKETAASALWNVAANAENKVSIASAGGIPPLVELLRSGTAVAKEKVVGVLRNLAANAENKVSIASAGGIPPLVELLQSGTAATKENAAAALANVSANADNDAPIASAGGIPALVELLRSGTAVAKEKAAGALWKLSVNIENQVLIASAGGIPPLVELLRSGTAVAKEKAAGALWNLSVNAENQVSIASAGGIPPLVELLRSGTAVAKENAAAALGNLALNAENKVSIASAGGIPALVELLRSGTAVAKENAVVALGNLSVNAENRMSIASAGGIPALVELLRSGTAVAKEDAAGALFNLSLNTSNRDVVCTCGGLEALRELSTSGNAEQKRRAKLALGKY